MKPKTDPERNTRVVTFNYSRLLGVNIENNRETKINYVLKRWVFRVHRREVGMNLWIHQSLKSSSPLFIIHPLLRSLRFLPKWRPPDGSRQRHECEKVQQRRTFFTKYFRPSTVPNNGPPPSRRAGKLRRFHIAKR